MVNLQYCIRVIVQTVGIAIILLAGLELSLLYIFNYKTTGYGITSCNLYDNEHNLKFYKPNCQIFFKHWEQENVIDYSVNSFGRRDLKKDDGEEQIAFVGDSFTFGVLVPIDKNYNYRAVEYLGVPDLVAHNYGVAGDQFSDVVKKLKLLDFTNYKGIIYGLTPNDFFEFVDGSRSKSDEIIKSLKQNEGFSDIKTFLLNTAISKWLLHNLLRIDLVYLSIYQSRKPFSGYLESPISSEFSAALTHAFRMFNVLDDDVRSKLIIFLLPQRAQVVAKRLGEYNTDFQERFLSLCESYEITCGATNINELTSLGESHFPVDGHMTVEANDVVGRQLAKRLKTFLVN